MNKGILLKDKYPEIAAEFYAPLNPNKSLETLTYSNAQVIYWKGAQCGHIWDAKVYNRTWNKSGCPYCTTPVKKILVGFNDLKTLNPELAKEWHPIKNGVLRPEMFTIGSQKRVWWLGPCGHEWDMDINSRRSQKQGCPYCAGKRVLVGFNDLRTTRAELAKEWHPIKNGVLQPEMFSTWSSKRIWWLCLKCKNEWNTEIYSRSNGRDCKKCEYQKKEETWFKKYGFYHPMQDNNKRKQGAGVAGKITIVINWETKEEEYCQGGWEVKVAEYFNKNKIRYTSNCKRFEIPREVYITPKGSSSAYTPDFYLKDENKFIEIKGWMGRNDCSKIKWEWFHKTYPNSELWLLKELQEKKILRKESTSSKP